MMQTYYFDMKDGVPVRDHKGLEFATGLAAIEHGKGLARQLREDERPRDRGLFVVVLDESGREIHREPVYPAE
jgi:hypothetical protein